MQEYSLSPDQLLSQLKTTNSGLSETEAGVRLVQIGQNRLTAKKKISPLALYLQQFKNTLTLILIAAAFTILFVYYFGDHDSSDLIEAGLIFGIVFLITLLGFVQEFKAEKAIESLKKLLAYKAKVRRDGQEKEIDVTDLVPGDIVLLEEGAKVPGDIRLLEVSALTVNEASLTGESVPVTKSIAALTGEKQLGDQKNMLFAGTAIVSGRGTGVVVQTGDRTEIGKIAHEVAEVEDGETPIQKRLNYIGKVIGYVILAICAIVFVFIAFFAKDFSHLPFFQRMLQSFIASVALAVAAIPEGLPAVVTISLALGTQRMLKKNVLVRKLNSVETLGSTDVICSDKTGTLTKGEMTVTKLFVSGGTFDVTGTGYETTGEFQQSGKKSDPATLSLILTIGKYCNNAALHEDGKILGDPTEAALLVSAAKAGLTETAPRLQEIPFSSERKIMSVVVQKGEDYFVYTKGAPEFVLNKCTQVEQQGKTVALNDTEKQKIMTATQEFSTQALRNLGFAYKNISAKEFAEQKDQPEKLEANLTFVGLQGMSDPARMEVKALIETCHGAGIQVNMITGDHVETAKAIAATIGITGEALTGDELEKMDDNKLAEIIENVHVYARINPSAKMRIVGALQKRGHIVAMTGDGVNDAPALKKADIGIAMGITGTDVAKEASDMVLLDDAFGTIVAAIEEGRGIFHNIRKFVVYLLSCNIAEILVVFFGVMVLQELVLTATILLWINVVTDGFPAIALGLDAAEKGILRYPPKVFQSQIITKRLWIEMAIDGIFLAAMVLWIYWLALPQGIAVAQGAAFSAIVIFELVTLYVIRSSYRLPFFSNKWLLISVLGTILLQMVIVYTPFLSKIFAIGQITPMIWLFIFTASVWLWIFYKLLQQFFDARIPAKTHIE